MKQLKKWFCNMGFLYYYTWDFQGEQWAENELNFKSSGKVRMVYAQLGKISIVWVGMFIGKVLNRSVSLKGYIVAEQSEYYTKEMSNTKQIVKENFPVINMKQ